MPKAIWKNWTGGLAVNSENLGTDGMYAEARDVDPQREYGFIKPGWKEAVLVDGANFATLNALITDAVISPHDSTAYFITNNHIFKSQNLTSFVDNGTWAYALPTASGNGKELTFYNIGGSGGTIYLVNINTTTFGVTDVLNENYSITQGAIHIPDLLTHASYLNDSALSNGPHPKLEWGTSLWIGNGRYLSKLDGTATFPGTWTEDAFTLPVGWEITSLFPTENYIGICAWKKITITGANPSDYQTQSEVFFWNGDSDFYEFSIPVEDNKILSSFNDNGTIYLITEGRGFASVLRKLTETGSEVVRNLKFEIDGTTTYFDVEYHNVLELHQNRLLIGAENSIFSYGTTNPLYPKVMLQPFSSGSGFSTGNTGFVKQLVRNNIYAGFYDGTSYYLSRFPGNYSEKAEVKGLYKDFGREVQINYARMYFKDIVDSTASVSFDTDYGTSNLITNAAGSTIISHATSGTITSQKFDRFDGKLTCEAIRPVIDWTEGGLAISKVVVDYDPVSDR